MITRVSTEGKAGGDVKTKTDSCTFTKENALEFLEFDISMGYKPLEIKTDHIILEQYNKGCTWVTYQRYEGSKKDMEKLVLLAKANKIADTIEA